MIETGELCKRHDRRSQHLGNSRRLQRIGGDKQGRRASPGKLARHHPSVVGLNRQVPVFLLDDFRWDHDRFQQVAATETRRDVVEIGADRLTDASLAMAPGAERIDVQPASASQVALLIRRLQ